MTKTKTEWRLVPVPATPKMSEAGMATFTITSAHEKEIDIDVMFEAMCNAAPAPQASEPCERCADLEQRLHNLALDWQVKENKLAALEAENASLTKERDDWIACHAKIFRELQETRATIAPQAEQLVAYYCGRNQFGSPVFRIGTLPITEGALFAEPQQAKPCERCAELERRLKESVGGTKQDLEKRLEDQRSKNSRLETKLAALESSIGELNDSLGVLDICQIKPLVTQLEAENEWLREKGMAWKRNWSESEDRLIKSRATIAQQADHLSDAQALIQRMMKEKEQQAERINKLEDEIDKERQRRWDGNAESSRKLAELTKQLAAEQAKIDELMMEYCPSEMTPDQVKNYSDHQQAATPEDQEFIDAAIAAQKEGK